MKVLIVKLSSIGDVVHTLPALASLREGFRTRGVKARIDWLVEEAASTVLRGHPDIDNLIVVKNRGWLSDRSANIKVARRLAAERYDMVLDFQGLLKSGIWVGVTRARRRIGFANARELSHIFLNEKLPPYDIERHAVERYLDLAEHAGGVRTGVKFDGGVEAKKSIIKKLGKYGVGEGDRFFVLATEARWPTKHWSPEKFAELARRITSHGGWPAKAVFVGSAGDKSKVEGIRVRAGRGGVNLAGETTLTELAALMSLAEFVVTVDSGPMHIAAAAGTRVLAVFGPTAPWRTGPFGPGHVVVRKELDCSPCFKRTCDHPRCMLDITVEDVVEALGGMLAEKARGRTVR